MEFKGVKGSEKVEVYLIDNELREEDKNAAYPLSGRVGQFIISLLGSMSLLDKVRVCNSKVQSWEVVRQDLKESSPKVVISFGEIVEELLDTKKGSDYYSGQVFFVDYEGLSFQYIPFTSLGKISEKLSDEKFTINFTSNLYKAVQVINGERTNVLEDKLILNAHSYAEFKQICETYFKNDELLAYDIETNARPIFASDSRIIGFSLGNPKVGVYVSLSSLEFEISKKDEERIFNYLRTEIFGKHRLIIHNTQYERPYTLTCLNYAIDFDHAEDTLVMARLLKNPKEGAGLKYQAQKYLYYPDWEIDLTRYISQFRELISRIVLGPKKYNNIWSEIKSGLSNIFKVADTISFQSLSDKDKEEISDVIFKLKQTVVDLYSEEEILRLGEEIFNRLLIVEEQGGVLDDTIPYNWIPDKILSSYGAIDSLSTYHLYNYYNDIMDKESTENVNLHKGYRLWLEHIYVAYMMERNGMYWNEEVADRDRKFLDNQATRCLKDMLTSPVFKPMIKEVSEKKFKALILSDYLPEIPELSGYSVAYNRLTDTTIVKYQGKRVAKSKINEIEIPSQYKEQYESILSKLFFEEVNKAEHYEELKEFYNPSSSTQLDIPKRIFDVPELQMGTRIVQLHTLAVSPQTQEEIKQLPYIDQKFLKIARLLGEPDELKSTYGETWATMRKELYQGFCVIFKSMRNKVSDSRIKSILYEDRPFQLDSFDDEGIINIYHSLLVTGIDQDNRNTWSPVFEWMINFRLFKKSQKIVSSYIDGTIGHQSVKVVDRSDFTNDSHLVKRKRDFSPLKEGEDYILAAKWSPNVVETGRWSSPLHCHPGWTEIKLADGRDLPIEEVVKEFNEGKELFVYALNTEKTSGIVTESSKYQIAKIQEAYLSHYATEFVRFTLDNGKTVDVTPDHKMIRRDGYVDYAINFNEGDALYPAYFKQDEKSYWMIYSPGTDEWEYCHHLADSYNERHGLLREIPEEEYVCESTGKVKRWWCRHHKDFDIANNSPLNVIRVGRVTHFTKWHSDNKNYYQKAWDHRRERGNDATPDFYRRLLKKASEDPEFAKRWKEAKRDNGLETMKKLWESQQYRKSHTERNKVRGFNKVIQLLSTVYDKENDTINLTPEVYEELRRSQGRSGMGIMKWDTLMKYVDNVEDLIRQVRHYAYNNRKIIKKEYVTLEEPIPVYSLSIDEDSPNYALSAGISVKNTIPWGSQVKKYFTSRFEGGTCLAEDTGVYLASGEVVTIKELADRKREKKNYADVLTYDVKNKKVIVTRAINFRKTRFADRMIRLEFSDGSVVRSTKDHLFYDAKRRKWTRADRFLRGDQLLSVDLSSEDKRQLTTLTIVSTLKEIVYHENVYCCDVPGEGLHNYVLSNGLISHNCLAPDYCLVGDTRIRLLDGRQETLENLYNQGETEFEVYSYDITNERVVPGKAKDLSITKYESEIYEIILDNGYSIRCTGNHPFLTLDNLEYVKAEDLKIGESIQPCNFKFDKDGYEMLDHGIGKWELSYSSSINKVKNKFTTDKSSRSSRLIEETFAKIVLSGVIVSGETWNSTVSQFNLSCKGNSKNDIVKSYGSFINFINYMKDLLPYAYYNEVIFRTEFENKVGKGRSNTYKTYFNNFEDLGLFVSEDTWDSCLSVLSNARSQEGYKVVDPNHLPHLKEIYKYGVTFEDLKRYSRRNHRVVKIKVHHLDKPVPVYDLQVDTYHNFLVCTGSNSGVFVHNSQMEVRSLSAISKDKNMLELFHSGRDFHTETARSVFRKDEVTTAERRYSKTACWFGDTKIKLLDGFSMTIKDMYESKKKDYDVYSFDLETEQFCPGKTYDVQLSKYVEEYAEVTLDNGAVLRCTTDHPFLTREGTYVKAADLYEGLKLETLFTRYASRGTMQGYEQYFDTRHRYLHATRNPHIYQTYVGKWKMTHRSVYRKSKKGYQIDHINGKKEDNRPKNLQEIKPADNRAKSRLRVELNDKFNSLPGIIKRIEIIKSEGKTLDTYDDYHTGTGDRFYKTLDSYLPMEDIWSRTDWYKETYLERRRSEGCVKTSRSKASEKSSSCRD